MVKKFKICSTHWCVCVCVCVSLNSFFFFQSCKHLLSEEHAQIELALVGTSGLQHAQHYVAGYVQQSFRDLDSDFLCTTVIFRGEVSVIT